LPTKKPSRLWESLLGLVVAVVFVMLVMFTACFAHVLLRVGVERLLAARRADRAYQFSDIVVKIGAELG
jgi:uncharacterized membrane protein